MTSFLDRVSQLIWGPERYPSHPRIIANDAPKEAARIVARDAPKIEELQVEDFLFIFFDRGSDEWEKKLNALSAEVRKKFEDDLHLFHSRMEAEALFRYYTVPPQEVAQAQKHLVEANRGANFLRCAFEHLNNRTVPITVKKSHFGTCPLTTFNCLGISMNIEGSLKDANETLVRFPSLNIVAQIKAKAQFLLFGNLRHENHLWMVDCWCMDFDQNRAEAFCHIQATDASRRCEALQRLDFAIPELLHNRALRICNLLNREAHDVLKSLHDNLKVYQKDNLLLCVLDISRRMPDSLTLTFFKSIRPFIADLAKLGISRVFLWGNQRRLYIQQEISGKKREADLFWIQCTVKDKSKDEYIDDKAFALNIVKDRNGKEYAQLHLQPVQTYARLGIGQVARVARRLLNNQLHICKHRFDYPMVFELWRGGYRLKFENERLMKLQRNDWVNITGPDIRLRPSDNSLAIIIPPVRPVKSVQGICQHYSDDRLESTFYPFGTGNRQDPHIMRGNSEPSNILYRVHSKPRICPGTTDVVARVHSAAWHELCYLEFRVSPEFNNLVSRTLASFPGNEAFNAATLGCLVATYAGDQDAFIRQIGDDEEDLPFN